MRSWSRAARCVRSGSHRRRFGCSWQTCRPRICCSLYALAYLASPQGTGCSCCWYVCCWAGSSHRDKSCRRLERLLRRGTRRQNRSALQHCRWSNPEPALFGSTRCNCTLRRILGGSRCRRKSDEPVRFARLCRRWPAKSTQTRGQVARRKCRGRRTRPDSRSRLPY